jgi:L-ascorbate metabolism protein UlaG (beta-lactamase superfamily)
VHLWREWTIESRHPIAPPFARPQPAAWDDARLTLAWLGHSTVLINFFGINVLTDPALFSRIGIRLPGFTIGPKRLTAPALEVLDLPRIDLVLLSHAHFDHFDMRTLHRFGPSTAVITASRTSDLLGWTRLRKITELRCGQATEIQRASASLKVRAIRVEALGRAAAP